jgi:predicted nucleic acid-binding protein
MTRVFIDTDVIIDFLADRKPFSESATILFHYIDKKEIEGYTSAQSISNLYYILRKFASHKKVIQALKELTAMIGILPVDQVIVGNALQSVFTDFEDAIQNYCAEAAHVDAIITRNIKDYKRAGMAVMSPDMVIRLK